MKAKPHILIASPKLNLFKKHTITLKCIRVDHAFCEQSQSDPFK